MKNSFIDYLNSMNNADGDSMGALAEYQITSEYYNLIRVERKIGDFIADAIKQDNHTVYIITGHAGDGKTSILTQILGKLNLLKSGEKLSVIGDYSGLGKSLLYIKDMSELSQADQVERLSTALRAPDEGRSSIIISNTGPLINTAERFAKLSAENNGKQFDEDDRINLQTILLEQLDTNEDKLIYIAGFPVLLINLARVDNVFLAKQILGKMFCQDLWTLCESCEKREFCPAYTNYKLVTCQFERVSDFVEAFYRYLYENDQRLTIRQILAQLSYAITANLSCEQVTKSKCNHPEFYYNFANLFFGYRGLQRVPEALQIRGIYEASLLGLDSISLDVDYSLFVRQEYSCFTNTLRIALEDRTSQINKRLISVSSDKKSEIASYSEKIRKLVRRFYLMFSLVDDEDQKGNIFNQVFGKSFFEFSMYTGQSISPKYKNKLRNLIYDALYMLNTGFMPEGDGKKLLPLTLKRKDEVFQNVLIVLGQLNKENLVVTQEKENSRFEDNKCKYNVFLSVTSGELYRISLPLLDYFQNVVDGAIVSSSTPALTHGVAKLNTMILSSCRFDKENNEITFLVNTATKQYTKKIQFNGNDLWLEE